MISTFTLLFFNFNFVLLQSPDQLSLLLENCRSICNKGPLIHDLTKCSDLDIFAPSETLIRPLDTDNLLNSLTPPNYKFIQKPWATGQGRGVGFL